MALSKTEAVSETEKKVRSLIRTIETRVDKDYEKGKEIFVPMKDSLPTKVVQEVKKRYTEAGWIISYDASVGFKLKSKY